MDIKLEGSRIVDSKNEITTVISCNAGDRFFIRNPTLELFKELLLDNLDSKLNFTIRNNNSPYYTSLGVLITKDTLTIEEEEIFISYERHNRHIEPEEFNDYLIELAPVISTVIKERFESEFYYRTKHPEKYYKMEEIFEKYDIRVL